MTVDCKHCGAQIHKDKRYTWKDNSGSDVCGWNGGNEPHEPVYDELVAIRLADMPDTRCGNCGCLFGQPYSLSPVNKIICERAIVVTDFRTDVLCRSCKASYNWLPEDWARVNPEHYVRIPRG
jgi:hypothetical protein